MLGRVILFAAGAYVIAFGWSFATIAFPETCHGPACFVPALGPDTVVDIRAFVSMQEHLTPGSDAAGVWSASGVRLYEQMNATLTIPIPREVRRENASLWLHIFVYRRGALDATPDPAAFQPVPPLLVARTALVAHLLPYSSRDYLLQGSSERAAAPRLPVPHYRYGGSALRVRIVQDEHKHRSHVLACGMLLRALPDRRAYMPYFYVDDFNVLRRHAREMSPELDRPHPALTLEWLPRSLLAHRVISHAEDGFTKAAAMMRLGPEDMDDLRELFGEERLYRLALEQLFGWTHMVLAYLAFSSDVGFFRGRQNVAGLSARSLGSSALSSLIILLYLWDGEDVNRVILYSSTLDFGLQSWKLWTVWRARALTARRFAAPSTGDASRDAARAEAAAREAATESFDALGASVLGHALAPLAVGLALYTLIMYPHKSWWSWLVGAAAKCVYLFGFVGMTPQLFVNYKLKSVAHLPWRMLFYKAFNTFVDDAFALMVSMPTAHRIACLRDDVVFFILLYQRWCYPIDRSRANEFGYAFEAGPAPAAADSAAVAVAADAPSTAALGAKAAPAAAAVAAAAEAALPGLGSKAHGD